MALSPTECVRYLIQCLFECTRFETTKNIKFHNDVVLHSKLYPHPAAWLSPPLLSPPPLPPPPLPLSLLPPSTTAASATAATAATAVPVSAVAAFCSCRTAEMQNLQSCQDHSESSLKEGINHLRSGKICSTSGRNAIWNPYGDLT